jgi:hypothetical protein
VLIVRFIRGLVVALLGIATALGLAGPAHAQGPAAKAPGALEGVYDVDIDGQAQSTWEIWPICVPTVGDLRDPLLLPVACTLKVGPSNLAGREARMVDGQWQFVYNDSTRTCPDGSTAPQQTIYRFDPYNLTGQMKVLHGGECNDVAGMVVVPLTLKFNRPLPIPVTQYPLICEPGGLRRCF